jgi:hypothetical protein
MAAHPFARGSFSSEELLAGFDEYLVEQFVRRTAVRKSRVVAFEIVRALDAAVFPRQGNIEGQVY